MVLLSFSDEKNFQVIEHKANFTFQHFRKKVAWKIKHNVILSQLQKQNIQMKVFCYFKTLRTPFWKSVVRNFIAELSKKIDSVDVDIL